MKICSVTIAPNEFAPHEAEATVEGLVDENIVTLFEDQITDFSEARNRALANAAAEGCDWAIILDCDERIHYQFDGDVRAYLKGTKHDMLHAWAQDHSYAKPRAMRLPAKGHWSGPTHECWVADPGSTVGTIDEIPFTFSELPKSEEQYRAKVERDRAILEAYTQEYPDDPRWWYYLGDTYTGLGEDQDAYMAFWKCWELNGWDEESAWSCYRLAELDCKKEEYGKALQWCTNGMGRHPGMAELPWLAGYCAFHLGRYQHAIWWEEIAVALNNAETHTHRINFRHEPALYEGPWDVTRYAYEQLGDKQSAEKAKEFFEREIETRKSRAT